MKPLLLKGHERPVQQVRYNTDGDLIFSCAKDGVVDAWYSHNGDRLGTYDGHKGAVFSVDVDSLTKFLVTAAADNTVKLWSVRTGECIKTWDIPTSGKWVAFSEDDNRIVVVSEERLRTPGAVRVFEISRDGRPQPEEPTLNFEPQGSKVTACIWSYLDKYLIAGHEDGHVSLFDPKTGDVVRTSQEHHEKLITDVQKSQDGSYIITSSKDRSAKIFDAKNLENFKTYPTETPLNSAALIPKHPYVIMGGGQDAMEVTTTSSRQGHFEILFWHRIFEEEVSRAKGGFGPCNSIAAHPQGKGYCLGGEDGYVRVFHFDEEFHRARPYGVDMEPKED